MERIATCCNRKMLCIISSRNKHPVAYRDCCIKCSERRMHSFLTSLTVAVAVRKTSLYSDMTKSKFSHFSSNEMISLKI